MKLNDLGAKQPSQARLYLMIAALGLAYFFSNFHRLSLGVLGGVMAEDFGLTSAQLGLLGSAFFYAYAIMQVPSGLLADRAGAKYLISGACLVSGIGTLWFGMANNMGGLAAARAVTGLAVAFVYVPALSSVRYWFGDKNLGTMTGLLVAMGQIGAVSASAPLKLAADALGWRQAFMLIGYVSLVLCVIGFFTILNKPKKGIRESEPAKAKGEGTAAFTPAAVSIAVWFFITGGARLSFQSLWGNQFFTTYLTATSTAASNYLMYISIGCILGALVLGKVCDKLGSVKTLGLSSLMLVLSWAWLLLLKPSSSAIFIALGCAILGFFGAGSFTVGFACVREFANRTNTGLLTGVNNCAAFLGSAVFTQVSGSFVEFFQSSTGKNGFFGLLIVFALISLLATIAVVALNKEKVFS